MTEESSTTSHLYVAMTTTGITQPSDENTVTSSSSAQFGIEFYMYMYFNVAFLGIGLLGTATNGLIIYALQPECS